MFTWRSRPCAGSTALILMCGLLACDSPDAASNVAPPAAKDSARRQAEVKIKDEDEDAASGDARDAPAGASLASPAAPAGPRGPAADTLGWSQAPADARFGLNLAAQRVTLSHGQAHLTIWPTLSVSHLGPDGQTPLGAARDARGASPTLRVLPDGGAQISATYALPTATLELTLTHQARAPVLELNAQMTYTRDVWVEHEVLRFARDQAPAGQLMGWDGRWREASRQQTLHAGQTDARMARWPWVTLLSPTAPGLSLSMTHLEVELDHRALHPFKRYASCPSAQALPSLPLDLTPRRAGQRVTHTMRWLLHHDARQHQALALPRRFPRGHLSAIIFTDHADQNQLDRTEALAFGHTGALREAELPTRGLVGHGLSLTKTVFLDKRAGYSPQLELPAFAQLMRAMRDRGVELGLHSVSGGTDDPKQAATLIAKAQALGPWRVWIDHEPTTNCEAISSQGSDPTSPHYMLGTLEEAGVRTYWAVQDLPTSGLNLLAPGRAARRAAIYTHGALTHAPDAPWPLVFASAWHFGPRSGWPARFAPKHLDALDQEHGLLIAHTYLDVWRQDGKFAPRALIERVGEGRYRARDDIDAIWAALAKRQANHQVLTGGVDALGHHLIGAMRVQQQPQPDGSLRLWHDGPQPLLGLTLRLPPQAERVWLDGQLVQDRLRRAEGVDLWLDLEPDRPRVLRAQDARGQDLLARSPIHLDITLAPAAQDAP